MHFSNQEKVQIAKNSISLSELLHSEFELDIASEVNPENHATIKTWCDVVAEGNWDIFKKRLSWEEIDIFKLHRKLSFLESDTSKVLIPKWIDTLEELMQDAASIYLKISQVDTLSKITLKDNELQPFEELLIPFVKSASKALRLRTGIACNLLSDSAFSSLEYSLLKALSWVCRNALLDEFKIYQTISCSSFLRFINDDLTNDSLTIPSKKYYCEFIKYMYDSALKNFFVKYPVLARNVCLLIESWAEANYDFILRLSSDLSRIGEFFKIDENLLKEVSNLQCDNSDRHNGGRSVILLEFQSGIRFVYKPRPIGIEHTYNKLLDWLNQQKLSLKLGVFRVLNMGEYGWVEYVDSSTEFSNINLQYYYQRVGMLICLAYILDATDLHYENIIISDDFPILIDLESLMHPRVKVIGNDKNYNPSEYAAYLRISDSVIRSGLLPRWHFDSNGEVYDNSGLAGFYRVSSPGFRKRWENTNTDKMRIINSTTNINDDKYSGPLCLYHEDIVEGFRKMYKNILRLRTELLQSNGPLEELFQQSTRFIFRHTRTYSLIRERVLSPQFLKNGIERSIQLDVLCKPLLSIISDPYFYPLLQSEIDSLEMLDIPYFVAHPKSTSLYVKKDQYIDQFFIESSSSRVKIRIKEMSLDILEEEINFIRYSLYSRINKDFHYFAQSNYVNLDITDSSSPTVSKDELLIQAERLATRLERQSIIDEEQNITWICSVYVAKNKCFHFQKIGNDLYSGDTGIALFMAALYSITLEKRYSLLSTNIISSLCENPIELRLESHQGISETNLGAANGVGSVLYAIARIHDYIQDETLLKKGQKLVSLITKDMISNDNRFDILNGSAGLILGLLALYRKTSSILFLDLATRCGDHLLTNRVSTLSGYRVWHTLSRQQLHTGFSHGSAGIAYSLLSLYEVTNQNKYLQAAEEAIYFERSIFSSELNNWPHYLGINNLVANSFGMSWCHGSPGIGLARLGSIQIIDNIDIRKEIEISIQTTLSQPLKDSDSLCCGNLGSLDLLITASEKLSRPELLAEANSFGARLLKRAAQRGHFGFNGILNDHPGFFQGVSGIGYELLRLAHPDKFVSVLLWH